MAKLKHGTTYEGPMAIFDDETVGHRHGFYALDKDGGGLLLQDGEPVPLTQVDLAPGDPDDGTQEFVVADMSAPSQLVQSIVELEPEAANGQAGAEV